MPTFAHVGLLQRLTGLIYFPITPLFPHFGLLGAAYLPAKFRIRFLEPIPTDQWGERPWDDKGLVQTVAEDVRARIQEELIDMRRATAVGVARDEPRDPDHRRLDATGAAASRRRSSATPAVEAIIGVSPEDPTLRARAHRVRPRRPAARAAAADRAGGGDRHGDRHAAGRRLAAGASPRVAHEANVIGTMNILAACGGPDSPVRKVVFKSVRPLLRLRARRPGVLHRGHAPPAPAAHAPGVATSSRPRRRSRASPSATRTSR